MYMMPDEFFGRVRFRDAVVSAVALGGRIVEENPARIALIIDGPITGANVSITTLSTGITAGIGVNITGKLGSGRLELTHPNHGPLCGRAWFSSTADATDFFVTEVILERDPLKQNRRANERR